MTQKELSIVIKRSLSFKDSTETSLIGHSLQAAYENYSLAWKQALEDRDYLQCLCDLGELARVINQYAKDHLVSADDGCKYIMSRLLSMVQATGYNPEKLSSLLKTSFIQTGTVVADC